MSNSSGVRVPYQPDGGEGQRTARASSRGGVWRKRGAKTRADEQEPARRRERRTSGQRTAKSRSVKGAERKAGGRASKAVGLITGDLRRVSDFGTEGIARSSDH